ncbi:PDZ domain-containing protein [Halobacillus yeomjeoni]|uniref:PDZ domain-containing protein n=1 Tax=Halobacillus yeomjeoni TaxID=311194 RepID=A0A931HWA4_9BACI|nr:PDZ domain-containing protein [Halobacillus yeomjeoni]MBH0230902.1 PDZ domain-containing protein [Halobacillus yeomjeoni]
MDVWLVEVLYGLGRVFTQPFIYMAIIMGAIVSRRRIKRERKQFGIKIFNPFAEFQGTWGTALIAGMVFSIFSLIGGMVVTWPLLLLVAAVTFLVSLPLKLKWYSSVYIIGISSFVIFGLSYIPDKYQELSWISTLQSTPFSLLAVLLSVLLFVEAVLMLRTTPHQSFPERIKGRRGMWIGQHRGRKLAVVPFLAFLPVGSIEPLFPWWPLLSVGGESFGLIVIPFLTGWEWVARGQSPVHASKTIGRHIFLMALVVTGVTIGGFYLPILSLAAVAIGLAGRIVIYMSHRMREDRKPFFTSHYRGLRILGVLPGSPAEQMGLIPGELIERVNALPVGTENQFYEALQVNGGFNKIEVRDEWGENRYVQRALYEGEHFELGLVFVEPPTHEKTVGFFGQV